MKTLLHNGLFIIALSFMSISCPAQKPTTNNLTPTPTPTDAKTNAEGWKRYQLENKNGDVIGVYLPQKPEEFLGGKFRVAPNVVLPTDLYIVAANEEFYAVVFVNELPNKTGLMSDEQKADIFFGCWRGVIEQARQVLEKKSGNPVEVKPLGQTKVNVNGREGRVEDFTVGSFLGHARMLFAEKRAYMLVGLWPEDRAREKRASFLDSFEMRIKN